MVSGIFILLMPFSKYHSDTRYNYNLSFKYCYHVAFWPGGIPNDGLLTGNFGWFTQLKSVYVLMTHCKIFVLFFDESL